MTVAFTPAALADADGARLWYETQKSGLGVEFLEALFETANSITDHPEAYPVIHREIRRARLRRFPYSLFYVCSGEVITVIACFHARRNPHIWKLR